MNLSLMLKIFLMSARNTRELITFANNGNGLVVDVNVG